MCLTRVDPQPRPTRFIWKVVIRRGDGYAPTIYNEAPEWSVVFRLGQWTTDRKRHKITARDMTKRYTTGFHGFRSKRTALRCWRWAGLHDFELLAKCECDKIVATGRQTIGDRLVSVVVARRIKPVAIYDGGGIRLTS